jgi:hypothetical protein
VADRFSGEGLRVSRRTEPLKLDNPNVFILAAVERLCCAFPELRQHVRRRELLAGEERIERLERVGARRRFLVCRFDAREEALEREGFAGRSGGVLDRRSDERPPGLEPRFRFAAAIWVELRIAEQDRVERA